MEATKQAEHTSNTPKADRRALPSKFGVDSNYWAAYNNLAKDHDEELIGTLASHLDGLLVFAGIFAAVNSVFIVPSLDLLQPTAADEANNLLRLLLSQTINNSAVMTASPPWKLTAVGVATGFLFSGSLACSLLAALGALIGRQWLAHYQKTGQTGTEKERAVIRQKKFDGVKSYRFRFILDCVSLLIQFAVSLFLVGLMAYLWNLHHGVALMVITVVSVGFVIYAYTVWAAVVDPFCPFQTPLSTIVQGLMNRWHEFSTHFYSFLEEQSSESAPDLEKSGFKTEPAGPNRGSTKTGNWDLVRTLTVNGGLLYTLDDEHTSPRAVEKNRDIMESYAKSVRWVLKSASDKEILRDAAWNIPTLPTSALTATIFTEKEIKLYQLPHFTNVTPHPSGQGDASRYSFFPHVEPGVSLVVFQTPPYRRLVSLLQESLTRLLNSGDEHQPADIADVVVYGRAVCHSLIGSSHALQGFQQLSLLLEKHSSYSWRSTKGELRMLLACILSHPGFWEHIEDMDDSWDELDVSVLPIYIATISITSPLRYRSEWINQISCHWLSRLGQSSRVLGSIAVSLVPLQFMENGYRHRFTIEEMLPYIRNSYESDENLYKYILAALRAYPGLISEASGKVTDQQDNKAYTAFVKSVRLAIDGLHDGKDDYRPIPWRNQRRIHREDFRGNLASHMFAAYEGILQSVTDQLARVNADQRTSSSSNVGLLLELQHEVLFSLSNAVNKTSWGWSVPSLSPALVWRVATHIQADSVSLRHLLSLMLSTPSDDDNSPETLFRTYPIVATILTGSLYDEQADIRQLAIELFRNGGAEWMFLNNQHSEPIFGDADFAEALARHVGLRKREDDPDVVLDLLDALKKRTSLSRRLLDALYTTAASAQISTPDGREVLAMSLDVWAELDGGLPQQGGRKDWLSGEMLRKVIGHIEQLKEEYIGLDGIRKQQVNPTLPYLKKYISCVTESGKATINDLNKQLLDAFEEYKTLLEA